MIEQKTHIEGERERQEKRKRVWERAEKKYARLMYVVHQYLKSLSNVIQVIIHLLLSIAIIICETKFSGFCVCSKSTTYVI